MNHQNLISEIYHGRYNLKNFLPQKLLMYVDKWPWLCYDMNAQKISQKHERMKPETVDQ